jgi:site-specific DNA-methyltransferase (adenine-specific)
MIKLIYGDCLQKIKDIENNSIDLTVTSPPYDNLRSYNGNNSNWSSESWKQIISDLFRITKKGGVVVWVVGDATIKGSETGTSFKQALFAMDCGFNLHDTMIYYKNSLPKNHNRYEQDFEYMFVFSKGKPKTFNPIRIPCDYPEPETARKNSFFSETIEKNRSARSLKERKPVGIDKIKGNIWKINTGAGHSTMDKYAFKHPAIFPEKLARDHIISWSNEGDTVFDPFMGSGTTGKIAKILNRKFVGIEIEEDYFRIALRRIHEA